MTHSTEQLMRLAERGRVPTESEIRLIVAHPDPAPLVALLKRQHRWKEHRNWLPVAAYKEGMRRAEESKFPWNEILDALSTTGCIWPHSTDCFPRAEPVYILGQEIAEWVAGQSSDVPLIRLLSFKERNIAMGVSIRARVVTPSLIAAAIEHHPSLLSALCYNKYSHPEDLKLARDWANNEIDNRILAGAEAKQVRKDISSAMQTLSALAEQGHTRHLLDDNFVRRLLGWMNIPLAGEDRHPRMLKSEIASILSRVASLSHVDDVEAVASNLNSSYYASHVASDPDSSIELLRALARQPRAIKVWGVLAHRTDALKDPEILAILSKSSNVSIASEVVKEAEGKAFRRSFRKVVEEQPQEALSVLENRLEDVANALVPKDLAPIFADNNPDVRERALRTVHRVGSKPR